jgi:predicted nucleic acid-binding protein
LRLLKRDLDDGEAAVIALALERGADLVLIDESDGRRIADLYGLPKTGVLGLLLRAEKLRQRGRFRIEERLVRQALHAAGE